MNLLVFCKHHLGNVIHLNRSLFLNAKYISLVETNLSQNRISLLPGKAAISTKHYSHHSTIIRKQIAEFPSLSYLRDNPGLDQANTLKASTLVIRPMSTNKNSSLINGINSNRDGPGEEERNLRKKYEPREIKFDTPYGHIACLEWGKRDAPRKILCVHGWLDNAGSFERLVPFILDHKDNSNLYHIVAMDMPGVGHSSHRPPGADYTTFSNVIEMRRVTTRLGWTSGLTLLSHSLGAHFSYLYSCIYPKQVENFISIDVVRPITFQVDNWNVTIANSIENFFRAEYNHQDDPKSDSVVPVYTEEEALRRLMEAHSSSLNYESAKTLMKRGSKEFKGGFTFNRDVRHRHLSVEFRPDDELMMKYLSRSFSPNLFIIRSMRSPFRMPEEVRLNYYEIYKKNCAIFRDVLMDGTHHVHMNEPDTVALEINAFLDDIRSAQSRQSTENCDDVKCPGDTQEIPSPVIGKPNL